MIGLAFLCLASNSEGEEVLATLLHMADLHPGPLLKPGQIHPKSGFRTIRATQLEIKALILKGHGKIWYSTIIDPIIISHLDTVQVLVLQVLSWFELKDDLPLGFQPWNARQEDFLICDLVFICVKEDQVSPTCGI